MIRVRATGVCRSDWHAWMGHDDTVALPHVPGHEFAGEIAVLGSEVPAEAGWRVGDRVTAPFICACGRCAQCAFGNEQVCDAQSQPDHALGLFAEFVLVDEAALNLIRLPDSARLRRGRLARLPLRHRLPGHRRLRARRADRRARMRRRRASAIMIAVAAGVTVYGVDVSDAALEAAERLGAVPVRGGEGRERIVGHPAEESTCRSTFGSGETALASVRSLQSAVVTCRSA